MPTKITMPQLGESVSEGTVGRWLKQVGDTVKRDESLVEIITDKVTAELPSPVSGRLTRILVNEDETVKVGSEIAEIEDAGGASSGGGASTVGAGASSATGPSSAAGATPAAGLSGSMSASGLSGVSGNGGSPAPSATYNGGGMGPAERASQVAQASSVTATAERLERVSPLARRLAQEHGLDLRQIRGTGENGRIRKEDIEAHLAQRSQPAASVVAPPRPAPSAPPSAAPLPETPTMPLATTGVFATVPPTPAMVIPPVAYGAEDQVITPSPARRAIAEHMVRSKRISPHAWTSVEVDMTNLARWLERNKDEFKRREGYGVSFQTFAIKAAAEALREQPQLNASWTEDGKIVLRKQVHIGVSIALENNLMVPVIRNADMLNIAGVARAVSDLVTRARSNKLMPADLQGGTFTVNNPGVFGTVLSAAIINQPNAGILTMDAVVKRPVVVDDAIAIRSMMFLSLSFDHRVIDGLQAARFLGTIKRRLEGWSPDASAY